MISNNVYLSFDMNGNLLSCKESSDKIYSGSVATTNYVIDFSENLADNDMVYINFVRPDNVSLPALICERVQANRFKHLSTGKELDYELTSVEQMTINVIVKNRNPISEVTSIKTQSSVYLSVYPGSQYVPGIVED